MTTKGNATQILRSASNPLQIRFKSVPQNGGDGIYMGFGSE